MPEIASVNGSAAPVVYFVRIGKHIKIGFTTNLTERLKSFRSATAEPIVVLVTAPGGRNLEQKLHLLFAENRINKHNEFFRNERPLSEFIYFARESSFAGGLDYLKRLREIQARAPSKAEQFARRVAERRKTKAEEDAYYAKLVDERRQKLGW